MIVYTDDDIPIIYNPIQFNDEENIETREPENDSKNDNNKNDDNSKKENNSKKEDKKIPEKMNVNIVIRFICCCFHKE
jgi:hypothetical protein